MTHSSGLQYSYDDLDLLCCHGVDSEGLWMGSGALKQGRRTRCASMPEGCPQMSTDDFAQTLVGTASAVDDVTDPEHLILSENNKKAQMALQESIHCSDELVGADIPQRASKSEHLQTIISGNSGAFCSNSDSMSKANVSYATDTNSQSQKTLYSESDVGTESCRSHICNDDNVFKSPHISHEEQQYISIFSDNGPPLSGFAGEQPGKLPNHQETKESHTEGCSRPPEISEVTQNQSSVAELEPQTGCPDVVEVMISTSDQTVASGPVVVLHSLADMMESGNGMSRANKTVEPVMMLAVNEECDKGLPESWSADSAGKLNGLNNLETRNENTGPNHHSRDVQGEQDHDNCAGVLDQGRGCEIIYHTSMDQHNVEISAGNLPHGEESAQGESSKEETCVKQGLTELSDSRVKRHLTPEGNVSSGEPNTGYSEDQMQTNTFQCADQYEQASLSQSIGNIDQSLSTAELAVCEDLAIPHYMENSSSKLDTIPEISLVETDDTNLLKAQKNINDITQNPVSSPHLDVMYMATEQDMQNLPPCTEEVNEGLHGNQTAGCYFNESPASEVADGPREHHRPEATAVTMEESDEAVHRDTQLAGLVFSGTNESGDQKEDNVVKVRMRKVRLNIM